MGSGKGEEACSPSAAFFFLLAMVAGVGIQVTQKTLFQLKVEGRTGEIEPFTPKALTLLFMFCSMSLALPIHVFVNKESTGLTPKRVLMLGVPTVFDLITTALGTLTVQFLPLSTNSLLRGSVTIFVAIQKHFVLKDRLSSANWVGIGLISCAVLIVGVVGIVTSDNTSAGGTQTALLGVVLAFLSTFVASFQFVVQEKLMSELDTPPLVLCGCMGLAGVVLTLCVVYPAYYHLPGDDHGRFEDFYNTWHKFSRSPFIQLLLGIYRRRPLSSLVHPLAPPLAPSLTPLELFNSVLVLTLNASMLIVMQKLSSVWGAILSNARPALTWAVQLFLFYEVTAGAYGEAWKGAASFVQLGGFGLLLLGMAVYNGTIQLPGGPRATEHPILDMEASVRLSLMGPTAFRTSRMSVKNPSLKQNLVEP